jgi:hypothetical protein
VAILASALVTLPAAFSAAAATNLVNTADRGPLGTHRSGSDTAPYATPADLGATGSTPHDTELSQQLLHDAGDPAALAAGVGTGTGSSGSRADVPNGPLGIPGVVLDAYEHAQAVLGADQPGCKLPWWLLAGIGKIESSQAENGEVDANGTTLRPILGPELNGSHGFAALPAILGGEWTGDAVWQRAVGPMQFLPSTWLEWGNGGNPNNVYDAAIAAGRYLCDGGRDLSVPAQQAAAVFSYNHSDSYVQIVLLWANAYRNGVTPLPETVVTPEGPPVIGSSPTGGSTTTGGGSTTTTTGSGSTTTTTTTTTGSTTTTTTTTTTSTGTTTTTTTTTTTAPPTTTTTKPTTTVPTTTTTVPPTTTTTTCPPATTTTGPTPSADPTTTTTPPPPGCAADADVTTTNAPAA